MLALNVTPTKGAGHQHGRHCGYRQYTPNRAGIGRSPLPPDRRAVGLKACHSLEKMESRGGTRLLDRGRL
jgi:hypothetical protein